MRRHAQKRFRLGLRLFRGFFDYAAARCSQ